MYCVQCGVKLSDNEQKCPLCGTAVYHPDIIWEDEEPLYPKNKYPDKRKRSFFTQALLTAAVLLPLLIVLFCDLRFNGRMSWSGYVVGALLLFYVSVILPTWFKKPNPVIFVPCGFTAAILYLLYINGVTGGDWFLPFAFPVAGGVGLIVTAMTALLHYLHGGKLIVVGSTTIALGLFMILVELLMTVTFASISFIGWSFYPLVTLLIVGGLLLFLGCNRPARESVQRKFFI